MKGYGHEVTIFTSRFEASRAFRETIDGTLKVVHVPSKTPRHTLGKLHIFWAILRAIGLAKYVSKKEENFDVVFCDQISVYVPGINIFFLQQILFCCNRNTFRIQIISIFTFLVIKKYK